MRRHSSGSTSGRRRLRRAPDDDDDDDDEGRTCEGSRSTLAVAEPYARRRDGTRDEAARVEIMAVFGEFYQRILGMIYNLFISGNCLYPLPPHLVIFAWRKSKIFFFPRNTTPHTRGHVPRRKSMCMDSEEGFDTSCLRQQKRHELLECSPRPHRESTHHAL
jgi:hypothetical protein